MSEYVVHPAAMVWPMMNEVELQQMAASIQAHGQRLPIIRWHGQIIDGRNRLAACQLAGVTPVIQDQDGVFEDDAGVWDYCFDLNQHRRHLTAEQKREVIEARLRATPERSNRQIGAEVHVDHKTVAAQRRTLEATGEIPQLTMTVGRDRRFRRAPARRREPAQVIVAKATCDLMALRKRLEKCRELLRQEDIVVLRRFLEEIWDVVEATPEELAAWQKEEKPVLSNPEVGSAVNAQPC